jgi:hypothetical protein
VDVGEVHAVGAPVVEVQVGVQFSKKKHMKPC